MSPFRPHLNAEGLTEPQWRVLRVLHEIPEAGMSDIAAATMLLVPSISRMAKDLEGKGLVERVSLGHKPNQTHLRMQEKGEQMVLRLLPHAEACLSEMARRFGTQNMRELQALLDGFSAMNDPAVVSRKVNGQKYVPAS